MGLDNSETEGLENPFLKKEMFEALTDLGKDKAPGRMVLLWRFGFLGGMW